MTNILQPILSEIKFEYIVIFAVVMAICAIMCLIKKAIKVAIVVICLAVIVGSLAPMASEFQKNYKFDIVDGVAQIVNEGYEFTMDRTAIDGIDIENRNGKEYIITVSYKDGGSNTMVVPRFMRENIIEFADRYGIATEIRD